MGSDLYKDKERVRNFTNAIKERLIFGDKIVTSGKVNWKFNSLIKCIEHAIAYAGIREFQRRVWVKRPPSLIKGIVDSTHITKYLGKENIVKYIGSNQKVKEILDKCPEASTFSDEPPVATLIDLESFCMDDIRVYRYTKRDFEPLDIDLFCQGALQLLGTKYDVLQLINIALNVLGREPFQELSHVFDMGTSKKVCSVADAFIDEFHRDNLEKIAGIKLPRNYGKLNPKGWTQEFIDSFYDLRRRVMAGKWDIESTFPANVENTQTHFDGEYKLVFAAKDGVFVK